MRIIINARFVNNIRYADNMVLIASTLQNLRRVVDKVVATGTEHALSVGVNTQKRK